jgi:outer membrane protein, multidrug efflux system
VKSVIFALTIALLLSGCSTFREYTPPASPARLEQADFGRDNPARYNILQEPVLSWWMKFDDSQLASLVGTALTANLDIRIAAAHLAEARAIAGARGFDRFPVITANGSYSRNLYSRETPSQKSNKRTLDIYESGFDAHWEMDLFGRVSEQVKADNALADASLAELQYIYVTVAAEIARTYIELRGAQYRLDIAKRNAHNQEETYKLTQTLSNGGRASALDVSRAKTQLQLTRSRIPQLQAETTSAIYRLSVLTGQVPDALRETLWEQKPLPSLPVNIAVGDAKSLLERRPDILKAERELAASIAQYNVAAADLFPKVDLLGSIGFIATNLSNFGTSALTGAIGPSLSWRAFDLGRVHMQIKQADARSQAALARYEKTVLNVLEETQIALSNFAGSEEERAILQQAAASAQYSAQLAYQRFDQGADGFIDVLDAERTQLAAENALAEAEVRSALNLIAIYKALGGGWPSQIQSS